MLADSLAAGALGLSTSFVDQDRHGHAVPSRAADDDELRALIEVARQRARSRARAGVPPLDQGARPPARRHRPRRALVRRRGRVVHVEPAGREQPRPVARRAHPRAGPRAARRRVPRVRPGVAAPVRPARELRPDARVRRRPCVGPLHRAADHRREAGDARRSRVAGRGADATGTASATGSPSSRCRASTGCGSRRCATARSSSSTARSPTWSRPAAVTRRTCWPTGCSSTTSHRGWWPRRCRTTTPSEVSELIVDATTVVGASDAGAHLQMMCGAGDSTLLLTEHVRDRGDLTVEEGVHQITGRIADVFGIRDRGVLAPGLAGDVAVFALDELDYRRRPHRARPPGRRAPAHPPARRLPGHRGGGRRDPGGRRRHRRPPRRSPRRRQLASTTPSASKLRR